MKDLVSIENGQAVTTSIKVADYFGKMHKNVIRDIEKIIEKISSVFHETPEKTASNIESSKLGFLNLEEMFRKSSYEVKGQMRNYPFYYINRDGFVLLAMGFTGETAFKFKLKYINAFNAMEETLRKLADKQPDNTTNSVETPDNLTVKEKIDSLIKIAGKTHDKKFREKLLQQAASLLGTGIEPPAMHYNSSKFITKQIETIIAEHFDAGLSINALAKKYGVNYMDIYRIVKY